MTISRHRGAFLTLSNKRVRGLGCFSGNPLSMWMAQWPAEYLGIDLSERGVSILNRYLPEVGLTNARAGAVDFLAADFADESFGVIYAHAVLNHFENFDLVCREIHRVLKPGGQLGPWLGFDPSPSWTKR